MSDWDSALYHEISSPQQRWALKVLEGLALAGTEHALDIGCGTGHVTAALAARLPRGRVVAVDRSPSMLATGARWLTTRAPEVRLARVDASALPFTRAFDVVFSSATFHWVRDHAALFRSIVTVLRPGGRLKAQCGGGPNLALLLARADGLMATRRFAPYFSDWQEPWYFADEDSTRRRLASAGFTDVEVGLEPAPVTFDTPAAFSEFVGAVCVRHHLERLPSEERTAFLRELTAQSATDDPRFTLHYWRLNIAARRPA